MPLPLLSLILSLVTAAPLSREAMKDVDRQRLIVHLEMTESWLGSEVNGLSPGQLTFRMTPDSWSITDVVEHLAIAEPQYWDPLQNSMKREAAGAKSEASDADILWYGIDRTRRAKTGEARVPTGRFENARAALAEFRKLRTTMMAYAKTAQDDLRGRLLIDSRMDVYQWFLMISTHSQRHILQIREIKAHAAYPAK
ncbi:MAG: DinB family protein [Acidobacteria bacterium]|nr:DinB family protein [Acidobacteriota bacterium]MCA1652116.1 DinB family protein [Acidobacteriota bacterium]